MIHPLGRQLQVVLRALNDTIAPALVDADKHVVEQLQLSIATLSFVAARLPDARRFARLELETYADMAAAVAAAAPSDLADGARALRDAAEVGRAVLERADVDTEAIETAARQCRERIAALSTAARKTPARAEIERIILAGSAPIIAQARQWCAPFGFELKPQDLPAPAW